MIIPGKEAHCVPNQQTEEPWPDFSSGIAAANNVGALVYRYTPGNSGNVLPSPGLAGERLLRMLRDFHSGVQDGFLLGASHVVAAIPTYWASVSQYSLSLVCGGASAPVGLSPDSIGGLWRSIRCLCSSQGGLHTRF
jgi:hypothetical protein